MDDASETWLERIRPRLRLPYGSGRAFRYVGSAAAGADWVEPERVIYDHELVLFAKGRFTVAVGGREILCPEGSFLIVPPGVAHASWNSGGRAGFRHWVHFDWVPRGPEPEAPVMTFGRAALRPEWLRPAPDFVPREILHGRIAEGGRALALHRDLSLWLDPSEGRTFRTASGLLLSLLLEILEPPEAPSRTPRAGEALAEDVRALLDATVEKGGPLPETGALLESLGASHEHASRCFRKRYGVSPHRYLQSLRATRAQSLLRSGTLRVSRIADQLGFANASWFSQWFRAQTGLTPREWMRR